jgi:hypothetical protein
MAFGRSTAPAIEFEERKGPELFKFEKEGDEITGVLVAVEKREFPDEETGETKSVPVYVVEKYEAGFKASRHEIAEFMQAADLRRKLTGADRGKFILVRYETTQKVRQGTMKVFKVQVSKNTAPGVSTITDEDVSF